MQVQGRLILLPLLCLAACAHEQPIRVAPLSIHLSPPRYAARAVQPVHAAPSPCARPAARKLTRVRKDELFRQFAAQDGPRDDAPAPDDSPLRPAKARQAACRAAGR